MNIITGVDFVVETKERRCKCGALGIMGSDSKPQWNGHPKPWVQLLCPECRTTFPAYLAEDTLVVLMTAEMIIQKELEAEPWHVQRCRRFVRRGLLAESNQFEAGFRACYQELHGEQAESEVPRERQS